MADQDAPKSADAGVDSVTKDMGGLKTNDGPRDFGNSRGGGGGYNDRRGGGGGYNDRNGGGGGYNDRRGGGSRAPARQTSSRWDNLDDGGSSGGFGGGSRDGGRDSYNDRRGGGGYDDRRGGGGGYDDRRGGGGGYNDRRGGGGYNDRGNDRMDSRGGGYSEDTQIKNQIKVLIITKNSNFSQFNLFPYF